MMHSVNKNITPTYYVGPMAVESSVLSTTAATAATSNTCSSAAAARCGAQPGCPLALPEVYEWDAAAEAWVQMGADVAGSAARRARGQRASLGSDGGGGRPAAAA